MNTTATATGLVPATGLTIGGKLRLDRLLRKGGMGSIWVARHLLLDTDVAVKFMLPTADMEETALARFEREAKVAASIKSPHVVQMLDYGFEDGTPYIVMELLQGEDLGATLARHKRLSLRATFQILVPLCKALRRAHAAGLVHRDLKPGNVFLARDDDEEIVKILDFGIVKASGADFADITGLNALFGSPGYMSPEQVVQSQRLDHRSDLWSLSVMLYEMLTGRLPVDVVRSGLFVAICTSPIAPPSTLVAELGPEVDRFFVRALSRSPDARFQSAGELADAFAALVGERGPMLSLPGQDVATPSRPAPPASVPPPPMKSALVGPAPSEVDGYLAAASTSRTSDVENTVISILKAVMPTTAALRAPALPASLATPTEPLSPVLAAVEEAGSPRSSVPSPLASSLSGSIVLSIVPPAAMTTPGDQAALPPEAARAATSVRARRRALFGIAAACSIALIAAAALRGERPSSEPGVSAFPAAPRVETPLPAEASMDPAAVRAVQLAVEPGNAHVEVDGRALRVRDGAVELRGALGSVHRVRLFSEQGETNVVVVITASGVWPPKVQLSAMAPSGPSGAPPRVSRRGPRSNAPTLAHPPSKAPARGPAAAERAEPLPARTFE